jgi:restriction system protein
MTPMLHVLSDGQARHINQIADLLADHFRLSDTDRLDMIPSGKKTRHYDRVGWAATYMKQAGLLIKPSRGWYELSARGYEVVRSGDVINTEYLWRFPEFVEFQTRKRENGAESSASGITLFDQVHEQRTPEENILAGYRTLRATLTAELLERVKQEPPGFFERLVVDLLVAMGYGGTRAEAGQRVGQSGDDGIDGVINEDRLGLDVVYVQAKRWNNSVGSAVVREFSGSLELQGARKGVLITTGTFTRDAMDTAARIPKKIVLIDGERLAELMIEFNVGVAAKETHVIKRIDEDYFSGE